MADIELSKTVNSGLTRRYPIIAALGSSSFANGFVNPPVANSYGWDQRGWYMWVGRLCPQVRLSTAHIVAQSGQTSDWMLANVDTICNALPKASACLIQLTSNDETAAIPLTVEQSLANYMEIGRRLLAAGIPPIFLNGHPLSGYNANATQRAKFFAKAEYMRHIARYLPGSWFCDTSEVIADRSASGLIYQTKYNNDGTHLNGYGYFEGVRLAIKPMLDKLFPVADRDLAMSDLDIWSTENPYGCMHSNPTMLGTGGSRSGSVTSGSVADGLTLSGTMTGVTVAASKATGSNGWPCQRLASSGTYSGSSQFLQVDFAFNNTALAALAVDDQVELACDVEFSGTVTNAGLFALRCDMNETGQTNLIYRNGIQNPSQEAIPVARKERLRIPARTIRAAVTTGSGVRLLYFPVAGADTTGLVIDILASTLRKMPPTGDGVPWG